MDEKLAGTKRGQESDTKEKKRDKKEKDRKEERRRTRTEES